MFISIGSRLPDSSVYEIMPAPDGCAVNPVRVDVREHAKGRRIAILGLPGAFTPTCSVKHLPGFVNASSKFSDRGIEEIWCVSVNDAYVMHAWGREQGALGLIKMMGDGNASFTSALGLNVDYSNKGMGTRSRRYSMLVDDGVVTRLNVDEPGVFQISGAETLLLQMG